MPPAGEVSIKPGSNDLPAFFRGSNPATKDKDIGIVMLFCHLCHESVGDQSGADMGELVGCYRNTDAGTAEEDTGLCFAPRDGTGNLLGKIRIIDRFGIKSAAILKINSALTEKGGDCVFQLQTAMIRTEQHHIFLKSSVALVPPKPKELLMAYLISAFLALFGT